MTNGLTGVGKMPFNEVMIARERIENHQAQQQMQKEHALAHKLEKVLERQKLDLMSSYDRFGAKNTELQPQGQVLDMEV